MPRNWTRAQQRRYKEERQRQAARVADRLMGRKKYIFDYPYDGHDDMVNASMMAMSMNLYTPSPRRSSIIYGITGV